MLATRLILTDKSGLSLLEMMIGSGILGILMLAIMSLSQLSQKSQLQSNSTFNADLFRRNVLTLVANDRSWANTVAHAPSPGLGCLKPPGTQCTTTGIPADPAISDQSFALYDGMDNTPYYDSTQTNAGFTSTGQVCNTFDSTSGNDSCPFHIDLKWSAQCVPPNCVNPLARVVATVTYKPATTDRRIAFSGQNYGFDLFRAHVGDGLERTYSAAVNMGYPNPATYIKPVNSLNSPAGVQAFSDWHPLVTDPMSGLPIAKLTSNVNPGGFVPTVPAGYNPPDLIPPVTLPAPKRVDLRFEGNMKWEGVTDYATFPTGEPVSYLYSVYTAIIYSRDGGATWIYPDFPKNSLTGNTGGNFNAAESFVANPGDVIRAIPITMVAVRNDLVCYTAANKISDCISQLSFRGLLSIHYHDP